MTCLSTEFNGNDSGTEMPLSGNVPMIDWMDSGQHDMDQSRTLKSLRPRNLEIRLARPGRKSK